VILELHENSTIQQSYYLARVDVGGCACRGFFVAVTEDCSKIQDTAEPVLTALSF
jgi:hypothetical protein